MHTGKHTNLSEGHALKLKHNNKRVAMRKNNTRSICNFILIDAGLKAIKW